MSLPRAAGILLHPTSLPSHGGVGDFGPAAYSFVDFLAAARQGIWQVLPLGPLGYGNSPYSATSAFAGNPILISLERLADQGWIDRTQLAHLDAASGPVDYDRVFHQKFGYGHVVKIDGNKLTIAFEKAGEKKVVDSFVERV